MEETILQRNVEVAEYDQKQDPTEPERTGEGGSAVESSHTSVIHQHEQGQISYVLLQTVPKVLKNRKKINVVNVLLEDGSTKTYINSDAAAELELNSDVKEFTVNMFNGLGDSFETHAFHTCIFG